MNPIKFFKEVRSEGKKITWPSRNETTVSTIGVFVIVAIFLYFADQVIAWLVRMIINLGM